MWDVPSAQSYKYSSPASPVGFSIPIFLVILRVALLCSKNTYPLTIPSCLGSGFALHTYLVKFKFV